MPIDVGRHSDGRVPQYFAHDLKLDSTRKHQARRRVTELMRMPMLAARSWQMVANSRLRFLGSIGVPRLVVKINPVSIQSSSLT